QAREPARGQVARGDVDERAGRPRGGLPVAGEAAVPLEPGEGALDHPAPRQGLEALLARRRRDHLDPQPQPTGRRLDDRPAVAAIAHSSASRADRARAWARSSGAASGSWTLAGVTSAARTVPSVSTTRCRLRPLTCLPAS